MLNECADILATKGVNNEPETVISVVSGSVQYVVPMGEDTDSTEYSLLDGEETPFMNGRDDLLREGLMFVMKDGDRYPLTQYVSDSEPTSEVSDIISDADSDVFRCPHPFGIGVLVCSMNQFLKLQNSIRSRSFVSSKSVHVPSVLFHWLLLSGGLMHERSLVRTRGRTGSPCRSVRRSSENTFIQTFMRSISQAVRRWLMRRQAL
jgi:hypothetical protein